MQSYNESKAIRTINSCKTKRSKPVIKHCVIRAEESVEEATIQDADKLRIEGEWVWYHGCRRVGARRTSQAAGYSHW